MPARIDITGSRFSFITVLEMVGGGGRMHLVCECDCGNVFRTRSDNVKSGNVKSCGCYQRTLPEKDGLTKHYLYDTHKAMNKRCHDKGHMAYDSYGGRGIEVCAEWRGRDGMGAFISYVDSILGERPEGHTLDRIDNDEGYREGNIRWASRKMQANNRRNSE